ncbi:MAG: hypothetical protein ACREH6_14530 [Geminicoccaceae bacterium]
MDVPAATGSQIEARDRRMLLQAWLLATVDLAVIYGCFAAGRMMNYWFSGIPWAATWSQWRVSYGDTRAVIFVALGLACLITFWRLGHYGRQRPFWQELGDVLGVALTMAVLDAALVFMTKTNFSRLWWVTSWTLIALLVPLGRIAIKHLMIGLGAWRQPTVVLGTGPNAIDAALALGSEPLLGYEVVAFIQPAGREAPAPQYLEVGGKRLPVLKAVA